MQGALMIVINSSPVINLTAALGGLELLGNLYGKVIVPAEVMREIEDGADKDKAADLLRKTRCADIRTQLVLSAPWMFRGLDAGEASVIQTALQEGVKTVVLDDWKGRRVARVAGLEVIGSIGVLVQAKVRRLKYQINDRFNLAGECSSKSRLARFIKCRCLTIFETCFRVKGILHLPTMRRTSATACSPGMGCTRPERISSRRRIALAAQSS